jgi:thiosulfate/3-mercaptopyruvate sulfurtransferase
MSSPLITAAELAIALRTGGPGRPTVLDVRWELAAGPQPDRYAAGHIPGAAFVDLERALSGPAGAGGRHPLPDAQAFTTAMRAAGVSGARPAVVYDGASSLAAARAWWLLRFHGHPDVRVLDGGFAAWTAAGEPTATGLDPLPQPGDFTAGPGRMDILTADQAARRARDGALIDARAPKRYSGDSEPLDPVGGHIPGARNVPMATLQTDTGALRDTTELQAILAAAGAHGAAPIGAYCGSGITAAHTVLALTVAGLGGALYPGSWSEWVTDPARPVATGPEPG